MSEPGLDRHEWESEIQGLPAREITRLAERDQGVGPGDVAAAINGYRAVFDYLVSHRSSADAEE